MSHIKPYFGMIWLSLCIRLFAFIFIIRINSADNINGAVFDLNINLGEVFADYADAQKLESAEKQNKCDDARIARNINTESESFDNN